jgi:hypothetical protein
MGGSSKSSKKAAAAKPAADNSSPTKHGKTVGNRRERRAAARTNENSEDEQPPTPPSRILIYPVGWFTFFATGVCGLGSMLFWFAFLSYHLGRGDAWWLGGGGDGQIDGSWRHVLAQRTRHSQLYHWWYQTDYYDDEPGEWSWRNLA